MCSILLGFGGLSVFLQVLSITSKYDLSIKTYVLGKFFQGIIAGFYTYIGIKYIPSLNFSATSLESRNVAVDSFLESIRIVPSTSDPSVELL